MAVQGQRLLQGQAAGSGLDLLHASPERVATKSSRNQFRDGPLSGQSVGGTLRIEGKIKVARVVLSCLATFGFKLRQFILL